jgi:hypothetical protein
MDVLRDSKVPCRETVMDSASAKVNLAAAEVNRKPEDAVAAK